MLFRNIGRLHTVYILDYKPWALDDNIPFDIIMIDYAKAFDVVNFRTLLRKLKNHGINGKLYLWIENWLCGRFQSVVLNGIKSSWREVLSSVIQGSVLSSILFAIYINDIDLSLEDLKTMIIKFADDCKFGRPIENPKDNEVLQNEINNIEKWSNENSMKIHHDKTFVIHFGKNNNKAKYTLYGKEIKSIEEVRDLGIIISSNCKVSNHVDSIVKKANSIQGMLNRTFICKNKKSLITLHKSHILPILEYASPVWAPTYAKDITKIEKVQRRITKSVPGIGKLPYEERLKICDIKSLENRRTRNDMLTTYQILNDKYPIQSEEFFSYVSDEHSVNTRSSEHGNLFKKKCNYDFRRNFFSQRVVPIWNDLPTIVRQAPNKSEFLKLYEEFDTKL